jgi:hypothetical protein
MSQPFDIIAAGPEHVNLVHSVVKRTMYSASRFASRLESDVFYHGIADPMTAAMQQGMCLVAVAPDDHAVAYAVALWLPPTLKDPTPAVVGIYVKLAMRSMGLGKALWAKMAQLEPAFANLTPGSWEVAYQYDSWTHRGPQKGLEDHPALTGHRLNPFRLLSLHPATLH